MSRLTGRFSSNRMVREYVNNLYLPAPSAYRRRSDAGGELGKKLNAWWSSLRAAWKEIHLGHAEVMDAGDKLSFKVPVYLGAIAPEWVRVELYADPLRDAEPFCRALAQGMKIPGAMNGYFYELSVPNDRPPWHYTPRVVPHHQEAVVPAEADLVLWQR
jgi:glycogen phosphorylase